MLGFHEGCRKIDVDILPAVKAELEKGRLILIIGGAGLGKTALAKKSLPNACYVSGHTPMPKQIEVVNRDLIGEELHFGITTAEFIQHRDSALKLNHKVIITGQCWDDVNPYLKGLDAEHYRAFDLNKVWELSLAESPTGIPENDLAN